MSASQGHWLTAPHSWPWRHPMATSHKAALPGSAPPGVHVVLMRTRAHAQAHPTPGACVKPQTSESNCNSPLTSRLYFSIPFGIWRLPFLFFGLSCVWF